METIHADVVVLASGTDVAFHWNCTPFMFLLTTVLSFLRATVVPAGPSLPLSRSSLTPSATDSSPLLTNCRLSRLCSAIPRFVILRSVKGLLLFILLAKFLCVQWFCGEIEIFSTYFIAAFRIVGQFSVSFGVCCLCRVSVMMKMLLRRGFESHYSHTAYTCYDRASRSGYDRCAFYGEKWFNVNNLHAIFIWDTFVVGHWLLMRLLNKSLLSYCSFSV